jgi:hypothetical protein
MNSVSASGQWTLGTLIGLPIAALALLIVVVVGIAAVFIFASEEGWLGGVLAGLAAFVAVCVVIGITTITYWPFKAEYHQYRAVDGTVSSVANRLVSAGDKGGSNQKFVVTLTSGQQQYGIEDTRAALLKPGDTVHLRCIRSYDYGSSNAGYDCKWGR